jgi:hypothetical protein
MHSVINTHVRRSNQIEEFYMECLEKPIGRIKRAYEEEQCTSMILKLGEIAGLKGILPPHSMHDLVKIVRIGLERAGVRAHRCRDPHHLMVEWGNVLKKSTQSSGARATHTKNKHAAADGGPRFIFDGDRGTISMLEVLMNPAKCKLDYLCKQKAIDVTG